MNQLRILDLALDCLIMEEVAQNKIMEEYKDYTPLQEEIKQDLKRIKIEYLEIQKLIVQEQKGA